MLTRCFISEVHMQDDGRLMLVFGDGRKQMNCAVCCHASYYDTGDKESRFFNVTLEVVGSHVNPEME